MKKLLLAAVLAAAALIGWGIVRKNRPPQVSVARVMRQTLISTLPTNGKVAPYEWQAVRAMTAGLVTRVAVHVGQAVVRGQVLAETSDPALGADVEAAQASLAEARAGLAALNQGGRPVDLAEIDSSLAEARLRLSRQRSEAAALDRLEKKQAATRMEAQAAADQVHQTEAQIAGFEKRRAALVGHTEIESANARVANAEAALRLARQRAGASLLRAPLAGEVYRLAVHPGDYLDAGGLVAEVGRLDRVRVSVYVDEPLLGRVAPGEAVTISWEALPGRQWQGTVEQMPSAIETLGSRQVGEVVCTIANPGRELIPGTNVDVEIRTGVAENAVVIPKEALRHDAGGDFVFVVHGDTVERRAVKTGISTVSQVQVTAGLTEGERVVLPTDTPLENGSRVTPSM